MKLTELKERAYFTWEQLCTANDAVIQPESFQPEVRKLGDLRRKVTWERAIARFTAWWYIDTCLEAWNLILYQLNFSPDRWNYEFRHLILDEFLAHPLGESLIKAGLEQLFSSNVATEDTRQAHGFFILVEEQSARGNVIGESIGLVRHLPELTRAPGAERH